MARSHSTAADAIDELMAGLQRANLSDDFNTPQPSRSRSRVHFDTIDSPVSPLSAGPHTRQASRVSSKQPQTPRPSSSSVHTATDIPINTSTATQDKPAPPRMTIQSTSPDASNTLRLHRTHLPTHEGYYFVTPEDRARAKGLTAKQVYSRRREDRTLGLKDSTQGIKIVFYSDGEVGRGKAEAGEDWPTVLWVLEKAEAAVEEGKKGEKVNGPGAL